MLICGSFAYPYTYREYCFDSFNLHQIVTDPTHFSIGENGSLLDFILTADPDLLVSHSVLPCIQNSDHISIFCSIKFNPSTLSCHNFVKERKLISSVLC